MAFNISGPSTKCSLYRKQSPAMVRRMSRLGRYDPSPIMCRARRWMAVRRAKVVGAALIHTTMPYSNTGRTKPQYTVARYFGCSTADAFRRKPSRWAARTASCWIWMRNASCLSKVTPRSWSSSTSGTTAPWKRIAFGGGGWRAVAADGECQRLCGLELNLPPASPCCQ